MSESRKTDVRSEK